MGATVSGSGPSALEHDLDVLMRMPNWSSDVEAAVASFRRLARRARAQGNADVADVCANTLAYIYWLAGRLEAALRIFVQRLRSEPWDMGAWLNAVRLQRALGRPRQALALARKATAVLAGRGKRIAGQRWRRAEVQYQAALSAHLLGDLEEAIRWLELCAQGLPKAYYGSRFKGEVLLLLGVLRVANGENVSLRQIEALAQRTLQRAKRHSLAGAALAVVGCKRGDSKMVGEWSEKAATWARGSVGQPFCHDNWQQTQAVLRRLRD